MDPGVYGYHTVPLWRSYIFIKWNPFPSNVPIISHHLCHFIEGAPHFGDLTTPVMTTVLQLKNLLGTPMHRLLRCVATGLWACNACDGVVVGLGRGVRAKLRLRMFGRDLERRSSACPRPELSILSAVISHDPRSSGHHQAVLSGNHGNPLPLGYRRTSQPPPQIFSRSNPGEPSCGNPF
ncbi:hypothetical protein B0H14DRAFT_1221989 [Mycena olivaceomarginata]|nr:hypothetical protein B0H14DRAFT_1221989 [Mycena olivaceomarginata]